MTVTIGGVPVRTAVVGAGAIGGSFAAHLLAGGWDPLLVDADADHVAAINARGLHVEGSGVDLRVAARATTPDGLSEHLDLVFLCVKSQHTAAAMDAVRPWLTDDGYVVSIQNGLNLDAIVERVGPDRVIAGFVNWAADYLSPGRIHFGGLSHFVLGEWDGTMSDRLVALGAALEPAFPAVLTQDILGYLWSKQVSIAAMFSSGVSHRSIPEAF
ncbi:MAG: 2-dehydropantoate 2-reductase N-terminal domain-containing protein, partial [Microbacterium sp.]